MSSEMALSVRTLLRTDVRVLSSTSGFLRFVSVNTGLDTAA